MRARGCCPAHLAYCEQFWKARGKSTLQAVARLCLLTDNVQNRVNKLCTLGVVTLGPVVASAGLSEDEVVRTKHLSVRAGPDGVHGAWFQVHQDGSWNVTTCNGKTGRQQLSVSTTELLPWAARHNKERHSPPLASLKYTLTRSSCKSESPW